MSSSAIVAGLLEILFSGLTTTATSIGSAISTMVSSIVFTGSGADQTFSPFFILVATFAGISLALGLVRWVLNFADSFGRRNR